VAALALTIRGFRKVTPRSRLLTLDLAGARFTFSPGQAALLGLEGQPQRQPYSIACSPEDTAERGVLEFLVGVGPTGHAQTALAGARAGQVVALRGPLGSFRFPRRVREPHVFFLAGGTGIAPIRSMLRHALAAGLAGRLGLLYSARSDREFAFLPELRQLDRTGRLRLTITATRESSPAWHGERGRFTLQRLGALVEDPATLCFVCGPSSLVAEAPAMLRRLGVTPERIKVEEW
jgi:ferredoxin-NADP reductase